MKKLFYLLFCTGLLSTVGCGGKEEDPPVPGVCNVVNVTEDITTPTTWTTGNVYVVSSIAVKSVLTIEPGVIVKLSGIDVNGNLDVQAGGRIIANGDANNRIVFTSLYDDSYCGDSNNDGNASTPHKGDWNSVVMEGGTNNSFSYCDFFYGGGYNGYVVFVGSTSEAFSFDHCTFAHTQPSTSDYTAFYGNTYMKNPAVSKFTNNVFYDNDRPLYCNVWYTVDPSNVFHNPANPSETNKYNGIFMWTEGSTTNTTVWGVTEVPYVVRGWVQAAGNAMLIINNGVLVKFDGASGQISFADQNNANISAGAVFTSFRDDGRGGDTNGDAGLTSPADGDWEGIRVNTTWRTANVFFDSH